MRDQQPGMAAYWGVALSAAVLVWAALFWAPVSQEARYHAAGATDYAKAAWIYDRLYNDPTPVDIAFIGSSRMMQGVNAATVEQVLDGATGRHLHVANLSLPDIGRDVPFMTARMLVAAKHPQVVFVETDYIEGREPAIGFPLLSSGPNLLDMPWLVNTGLPAALLYVPAHNARLLWNRLEGTAPSFDPAQYAGAQWDDTEATHGRDGVVSAPRTEFMPADALRKYADWWAGNLRRKAGQYDSWAWLQLRYNEVLLRRMLETLRGSGARIVFLYIPPVGMGSPPFDAAVLRQYGEIWSLPAEIEGDYRMWLNPTHPNAFGARRISDWLGHRLADGLAHTEASVSSDGR